MEDVKTSLLINEGLDLYSKESPAYHSRCIRSYELKTTADVSINYKRTKMFKNTSSYNVVRINLIFSFS